MHSQFLVHIIGIHNWTICVHLWGCTVHYLACTAQPRRCAGMEQMLTFVSVGILKCGTNENATLVSLNKCE